MKTVKRVIIVYGRSLSMEVNRYPTMDDLVSLITKIADNQDKMLEIMTMDPEDARSVLNAWYGKMVMDEVRKKFWTANEIGKKDDEIQDLKLENERLAMRNHKMLQVIRSIACDPDCEFCLLRGSECSGSDMQHLATKTLKELEEL